MIKPIKTLPDLEIETRKGQRHQVKLTNGDTFIIDQENLDDFFCNILTDEYEDGFASFGDIKGCQSFINIKHIVGFFLIE